MWQSQCTGVSIVAPSKSSAQVNSLPNASTRRAGAKRGGSFRMLQKSKPVRHHKPTCQEQPARRHALPRNTIPLSIAKFCCCSPHVASVNDSDTAESHLVGPACYRSCCIVPRLSSERVGLIESTVSEVHVSKPLGTVCDASRRRWEHNVWPVEISTSS